MRSGFDRLEAAGTVVEVSELPADGEVVGPQWPLMWKGDAHGMIDRAKTRLVAKIYSPVEEVNDFEFLLPPPRPRLTN